MSLTKVSYSMINGAIANVLDFGAVGDGVTDDTAAFVAAMAASECIYLGDKSYAVSNLTVDGKKWFGQGAQIVGDGALLVDVTNSYFENIYFHNTTDRGILITGRTDSSKLGTFYNCKFGKANEHIYQSGYCVGARFQNCEFGGIDSGGANSVSWLKGSSGYSRLFAGGVNTLTEIDCYTHWNKRGLYIAKSSGVINIIGGVFEYNGYYALVITAEAGQGSYGIRVNAWFENNGLTTLSPATYTENPIYLNAEASCAIDLTLAECTFNSDAGLSSIIVDSTSTSTIHVHQEGQNTRPITAPLNETQRYTTDWDDNDNGVITGTITASGLTVIGGTGVTYDNRKFVRKGMLVLFQFDINPNGGTTASASGSTTLVFTKLPVVSLSGSLSCWKATDGTSTGAGGVVPSGVNVRLYLPTWSADAGLMKISGFYISSPT